MLGFHVKSLPAFCLVGALACGGQASPTGGAGAGAHDGSGGAAASSAGTAGTGNTAVVTGGTGNVSAVNGGTGNASAVNGGRGGAETGGADTSGALVFMIPRCLLDLAGGCLLQGACNQASNPASTWSCFDNGVKVESVTIADPTGCPGRETRVHRPDGTLCYVERVTTLGCESDSYEWLDGNGSLVAGGDYGTTGGPLGTVTVTCASGERSRCAQRERGDCDFSGWPAPFGCARKPCDGVGATDATK